MSTQKDVSKKRERVPVSGRRNILTVKGKEDGYVYRWVNDTDSRILEFKEGGYDHVYMRDGVEIGAADVKSGKIVGDIVSKAVGQGVTSYLMKIPEEWYTEDQAAKSADVDAKEQIIYENIKNITGRYGEGIEYTKGSKNR